MKMKLIILHCVTERKNYLFHFYFFKIFLKKLKRNKQNLKQELLP